MTDVTEVFDAHAPDYERQRRHLIPPFDDFYVSAVSALRLAGRPLEAVLDLGAGTGLLSRRIAVALPHVRLTLLDGAPEMLARARQALGEQGAYVGGDLAATLPAGPWDAIVSALAIHHLDDEGKRALYGRALAALAPGGVFVNAEQVAAPSAALQALYDEWHATASARAGASEKEWEASVARKAVDRCAPVEAQLGWLREAGFEEVDCLYRHHCFAVMAGRRPPAA